MSNDSLLSDTPYEGVLRLRLNRPASLNAINGRLLEQLRSQLFACDARVVVLSSVGSRALSAGGDLEMGSKELARVSDGLFDLYGAMLGLPSVIIVAAEGHAAGAGAQLLLASDIRVASPNLKVRFAGTEHGIAGCMWGLPGLVGRGRALDLILTGRTVDAEEALRIGLVDRVVDEPGEAALELAHQISRLNGGILRKIKRLVVAASVPRDLLWAEQIANADIVPDIVRRPRAGGE